MIKSISYQKTDGWNTPLLRQNNRAEKLSIEDRQSLMAHSSSKTTTVYTHPNLELARDYINKLPNYSIGKKQNQNVTKLVTIEYFPVH